MALHLGRNLHYPGGDFADLDGNTWMIGQTGKSTLMEYLALQLMDQGFSVSYIDSLGASVPVLLKAVPKHRIPDVVYLDPFSEDVIGWNPLSDLMQQPEKVIAEMLSLLEGMLESAFMHHSQNIFRQSILALAPLPDVTFLHIERLLNDDEWRRRKILPHLTGNTRRFWEHTFEDWITERRRSEKTAAPENKLAIFNTSKYLRDILCAKERVSPQDIASEKILLANLHGHELGQTETTVLASLLLARLALTNEPHYVFIDNAELLSQPVLIQALQSKLTVILAHRYSDQVDVQGIMGNIQNVFAFDLNTKDAKLFDGVFPYRFQRYLTDQEPYTCSVKLGRELFRLQTVLYAVPNGHTQAHILNQSRQRYARSRQAVHAYLQHVVF